MARAIKAMFNFGVKTKGKIDDSKLKEPGKKDIRDIFKLSEGAPPQALDIREVDIDEVIRVATSKGLHYCECVDFTPNDGLVPLMIPAQEAAVWGQICVLVYGGVKFAESFQKKDQNGEYSAIYTIIAGGIMLGISAFVAALT